MVIARRIVVLVMVGILGGCFLGSLEVAAIDQAQKTAIIDHCEQIKVSLRNVQKMDSRTRVFLGSHYETILTKFVTSLNMRLVENNFSNADLIDNQSEIATAKSKFAADFIGYQQGLEELILIDCKTEPARFYDKLEKVREKRKVMIDDVLEMRNLVTRNIELVTRLKEGL